MHCHWAIEPEVHVVNNTALPVCHGRGQMLAGVLWKQRSGMRAWGSGWGAAGRASFSSGGLGLDLE